MSSRNTGVPPTLPIAKPGLPVAFVATGMRRNQVEGRPNSPRVRVRGRRR